MQAAWETVIKDVLRYPAVALATLIANICDWFIGLFIILVFDIYVFVRWHTRDIPYARAVIRQFDHALMILGLLPR